MEKEKSDLINSKGIQELSLLINEFCIMFDEIEHFKPKSFIIKQTSLLNLIYTEVSLLPEFNEESDIELEKFVTEEEWQQIHDRLILFFDTYNKYNAVVGLSWESEQVETLSLAEEMADIYQDLKDFSSLFNLGDENSMLDALIELKHTFIEYWGKKITRALPVLHDLIHFSNIEKLSIHKDRLDDENPGNSNSIISNRIKNWDF